MVAYILARLFHLGIVFKPFPGKKAPSSFRSYRTFYHHKVEETKLIMDKHTKKKRQQRKRNQSSKHVSKPSLRDISNVYTEKEYNSNDGMLTTVWGPAMWHYLHTMSFNYPVKPTTKDKKHYHEFITKLQHVLPCGKCRENLKENFKKLPIKRCAMKSRYTFSKYVYDLHELINTMLGKRSGLSYEMVRERYEHFRSRCATNPKTQKKRQTQKQKLKQKREDGCTEPIVGEKSKRAEVFAGLFFSKQQAATAFDAS